MQPTQEYLGSEQRLELRITGNKTDEMQDVLSRCLPSFQRKACRYLRNAADAEDAVQDALLAAYNHLDQFKGQAQMSTWLTSIVINCARMQLRRRPRQIHVSLDERFGEEQEFCLSDQLPAGKPSPEDESRASELAFHDPGRPESGAVATLGRPAGRTVERDSVRGAPRANRPPGLSLLRLGAWRVSGRDDGV